MDKAIAVLYPYIGKGATVLDIGCGWCGPARQLHADRACSVTGVTASADQAGYCAARGGMEGVIHADANAALPLDAGAHYDVALLMESISHVRDKAGLLQELAQVADKLVVRVNTYDGPATDDDSHRTVFGGSMLLPSTAEMKQLVTAAGWDIVRVENIRRRTKPTLIVYKQRLAAAAAAAAAAAVDKSGVPNNAGNQTDAKTQLQWLSEGVAQADGADDVVWSWGMTHGLVDIVAIPRDRPAAAAAATTGKILTTQTTRSECSESVATARATLLSFVRKSTEASALAPLGEQQLGFEDLLNCVLDVIADEEECAASQMLVDKLLLTSTKLTQHSTDALVANSNRYAVFLDPAVLGADLARKAAKTCLDTALRAPPAVTAQFEQTPRDAVLCLSQEWETPDHTTEATGRYYYQRDGPTGTATEEPIQSWQWNLVGTETTVVPRVYSRHQGNATASSGGKGGHVCGNAGFPTSTVVDLAQLSTVTPIEACWSVVKGGVASKHDVRIAPTKFGAVSSVLRLPNDLAQHPLFAAVQDTAVSLIAASPKSATLYFSPQEMAEVVMPAPAATADEVQDQCTAAAGSSVVPPPALGEWAVEVEAKLAAAFGIADLGNFMGDGFGKRHRHWSPAAPTTPTTPGRPTSTTIGITAADIEAGLTAAFGAGGKSGMLLNYRRNTVRVPAEEGPQTASDLLAELAAKGAAEPLSAVLEDADRLQLDSESDGIVKLRDELQALLGLDVNVNMYLSAENAAALPPHTDRYDVFVVQLYGAKDWNVCPPASRAATAGLTEAEAAMELELAKQNPNGCSAHKNAAADAGLECKAVKMTGGDVLYMPKGLVHEAKSVADGGISAHLTIGLVQKGMTWTDLFEANARRLSAANIAHTSTAVTARLAKAAEAVASSVPAGVAWHRALPVVAATHATLSLHTYYSALGDQLLHAATATLNIATDPFGAQRAAMVAAVQELTRADVMLAGFSELQRRATDAKQREEEAAAAGRGDATAEASLLKRSRKAAKSCKKGQPDSRFTCPDSGRSFDKNMFQPIGESCECDGYYGASCECDENTKYGKCEVDKLKCSCPVGKRIEGCAKDSAYNGGNCGSCVWNLAGDFCSTSDKNFQCRNNLACLDGYCCHDDVKRQYCKSCAKKGTVNGGKCDSWEAGYKGDFADPARDGCDKDYFPSSDNSRCLPAVSGGQTCVADDVCSSKNCLDKKCCNADVESSSCSACGTKGECIACSDDGKDPAFGCDRCIANGFYESRRSSDTSFSCKPRLEVGNFCQRRDPSSAAAEDFVNDHTRCINNDCRHYCCGPDVINNARNGAYCARCDSAGMCAACPESFTLATLANGLQECKQKCSKDDGSMVDHGEDDSRIMYESNEPIGDESCEQMAQTQKRVCDDGVFGAWEAEAGNALNTEPSCSDRCNAPSVENVFVCKDDKFSGANDCATAASTPYVKHGYIVARVRYLAPAVEPGEECEGQNQTQSCVDGDLEELPSKCTPGMSIGQQGRSGCTFYTYTTCNVNCAAGCTLAKELDETHCHDECNVDTCCFQHGTCASALLDEFADAKLLAFQESLDEAQQKLDAVCASADGDGDDAQVEIKNSACMMATSMEMGLDFLGRDQNFVDPLGWKSYEEAAASHIDALEALEAKLNNIEDRDRDESNFEFLASKMAILQTSQNEMPAGILRRINALDVNQASAMANLQREIGDLTQEQRDNFDSVRRGVNQMLLFSEDNMEQLSRVESEIKESEKRLVANLRDAITNAKNEVTEHLDKNTNMVLGGQDDLMDAVKENGAQLYQIQMAVHEINEQTMETQKLIKKMSGEYDGERADMIHLKANADALKAKIASNAGWDANENGDVDFDELMEMLKDFELFEGPALEMMEVVKAANLEDRDIALVEVRERIMASGDVRSKKFVENKGLDTLDNSEVDVNNDGTISELEMLRVLAEHFCLLEGGTQMFLEWDAGTLDASGGAVVVPGDRARNRREDLIKSVLPPKWSYYACKIQNSIKVILEAVAPRFSVAMVKDRIERVKALIEAIKSLISVVADTVKSCGAAIASIVGAIFSGGATLAATGGQMVADTVGCISGISETIAQSKSTFDDTIELGNLLYEDVMTIVDMVKEVIAIAKDDECELLEGADVRSLVGGIVNFAQDNLEIDVAGALEGDRALRMGLEYATRGLEALADPSADTLVALIPTELFGNLGISDGSIDIVTNVVHNLLTEEKWNDGISNQMIATALHSEFETFTDAVGLGPLVDKIEVVIAKIGKLAPPGTVDTFIANLGQGILPTAADLDNLVRGLPKLLSNFAGQQVTSFVAGLGDNSVVDKISNVVAQVGKFLPPGVLDTVLGGLNPGDLPLPEALGAFIAGLPDQIEDIAAGKIPAFVEGLKDMWPPSVSDVSHLIGELGRAVPELSVVDTFVKTLTNAVGPDATSLTDFVSALPHALTKLAKAKVGKYVDSLKGKLTDMLPDKIAEIITFAGKPLPIGTAIEDFISNMVQNGFNDPKAVITSFVEGLPGTLTKSAEQVLSTFLDGADVGGSFQDKVIALAAKLGKDIPGAPQILTFVKQAASGGKLKFADVSDLIGELAGKFLPEHAEKIQAFIDVVDGGGLNSPDQVLLQLAAKLGKDIPGVEQIAAFVLDGDVAGGSLQDKIIGLAAKLGKDIPGAPQILKFVKTLTKKAGSGEKLAFGDVSEFVGELAGKFLPEQHTAKIQAFIDIVDGGGLNSPDQVLLQLAAKLGKDIPGVEQIATFVQHATSGGELDLKFVTEFVSGLADDLLPEHASKIQAFIDVVDGVTSPDQTQIGTLLNALGKVVPDMDLDGVSPVVSKFIEGLGGVPANFGELKGFVQGLPDKLTTIAQSQIGTLLVGLAGGPLEDKIKDLVPKFGKIVPEGAISGFLKNLAGGKLDVTSLENFVTTLPTALGIQELEQVTALTDMIGGGVPSIDQLSTLLAGIGKVVPQVGELETFVTTHLQTGIATVDQIRTFAEGLQDGEASPAAVEKFVQTLGAGMNAQNDWWKAATAGAQLLGEKNVRTTFADVAKNALASTLGLDLGSIFGGGDRRRARRGAGTGQCHADKTASMSRLFAANRRFEVQRMRSLQNRLLELIHKEKRQLEYKWVTSIDNIELAGLTAADFRVHQAELQKYNLDKAEAAAADGVSERSVSFTVDRSEHPEAFAKLGVVDNRALLGRDANQQQATQMVFLIDAPEETRWYNSYVTEVETLLVPFPGIEGERIEVKITKDTDSLFITDNGMKSSAVRYQHAKSAQDYDYFTVDCSAASKPVLQSDTIRYSPYGRWRLEVQTQHITNKAALLQVDQIQFRFKLAQKTIAGAKAGLPMFANDSFAGESGVEILRDDAGCPGMAEFATVNVDQSVAAGDADGKKGMSAGGAAGLAIGVILIVVVLAVAFVKRDTGEAAQFAEDGSEIRTGKMARTFASFKLRLPSVRKRKPTITVEQTTHDRGRSTSVAYQIPMGDSIKSISELVPAGPGVSGGEIHAAAVKARSMGKSQVGNAGNKMVGYNLGRVQQFGMENASYEDTTPTTRATVRQDPVMNLAVRPVEDGYHNSRLASTGAGGGIKKKASKPIQRYNRDGSVYNGFDDVEDDCDAPTAPPKANAISVAPVEGRYENQMVVDIHKDMGNLTNNSEL